MVAVAACGGGCEKKRLFHIPILVLWLLLQLLLLAVVCGGVAVWLRLWHAVGVVREGVFLIFQSESGCCCGCR